VTIVRRPETAGGPFNVVLVDLEEGVRIMSTVLDRAPEDVAIGLRVAVEVADINGELAPAVRIAEERSVTS
jgi:uncharacterized protein